MDSSSPLIMFDGPDGAGKTTQFELARAALEQSGHTVFTAHLLGGSPIGEQVRSVIFSDEQRPAETNLYLCLAAYYALLDIVTIQRQLGHVILIDRSPLSIIAYQVYGDGLDATLGAQACTDALNAFKPSAVLLYEASSSVLEERRLQREKDDDYFEKMLNDYHERTQLGYSAAAKQFDAITVNATVNIDEVHAETMRLINGLID